MYSSIKTKSIVKKIVYYYEEGMWYVAQFRGEYSKLSTFLNESLLIVLVLKNYGILITPAWLVWLNIIALLISWFLGWLITKMGIVDFNNNLAAQFSPPTVETLKLLRETHKMVSEMKKPPL